jgi:hypothetical protein
VVQSTEERRAYRAQKDQQIRDRFHYHQPTPTHQTWFEGATAHIDALVEFILTIPDGQERAVALTQLGITRMLINAAIANTPAEAFEEYNA